MIAAQEWHHFDIVSGVRNSGPDRCLAMRRQS